MWLRRAGLEVLLRDREELAKVRRLPRLLRGLVQNLDHERAFQLVLACPRAAPAEPGGLPRRTTPGGGGICQHAPGVRSDGVVARWAFLTHSWISGHSKQVGCPEGCPGRGLGKRWEATGPSRQQITSDVACVRSDGLPMSARFPCRSAKTRKPLNAAARSLHLRPRWPSRSRGSRRGRRGWPTSGGSSRRPWPLRPAPGGGEPVAPRGSVGQLSLGHNQCVAEFAGTFLRAASATV